MKQHDDHGALDIKEADIIKVYVKIINGNVFARTAQKHDKPQLQWPVHQSGYDEVLPILDLGNTM
jgi:hypothetical protein